MEHLNTGIEGIEVNDIKGRVQSGGSVRRVWSGFRRRGVGWGVLIQVQYGIF